MHNAALQPHVSGTSRSRVVPDRSCISVSQVMWVMKQAWCHSPKTFKELETSNSAMHAYRVDAWRYLCLPIFHGAWTGTLNQPLINASCSLMHF